MDLKYVLEKISSYWFAFADGLSNLVKNDYFVSISSGLISAFILFLLGAVWYRFRNRRNLDKNKQLCGTWIMYRLSRMNGPLLAVDVEIYKNWLGILKCKFSSKYTHTGLVSGKVKITEHTINLMFTNRRSKGPFMIALTNHHIARLNGMRSGVVAGTTGDTGDAYCAKVVLSKEPVAEKEVVSFLKNYSSIIVEQGKSTDDLIALDSSNKALHRTSR